MYYVTANDRGAGLPDLWMCSKPGLNLNIISRSAQKITLETSFGSKICRVLGIYASTRIGSKRNLCWVTC